MADQRTEVIDGLHVTSGPKDFNGVVYFAVTITAENASQTVSPSRITRSRLLDRPLALDDYELGDEAFDRRVRIHGAPTDLLILCDPEARSTLLQLLDLATQFDLDAGSLSTNARLMHEPVFRDLAIKVARKLFRRTMITEIPARFRNEPEPRVRERLVRAAIGHPQVEAEVIALAAVDLEPSVQVLATIQRRKPEALIAAFRNPDFAALRFEIVSALHAANDPGCEAEMMEALDEGNEAMQRVALSWFAVHGTARGLSRVRKMARAFFGPAEIKQLAADTLASIEKRVDVSGGELSVDAQDGSITVSED